jgi:hypothetical protein
VKSRAAISWPVCRGACRGEGGAPASAREDAFPVASAAGLSRHLLVVGVLKRLDQRFLGVLLIFTALLWGVLTRGAFYQSGLAVFVGLSLTAMAVVILRARATLAAIRWWLVSALLPFAAVLVSAIARHELWQAAYAVAPVIGAAALGITGAVSTRMLGSLMVLRLIVDVTLIAAVLGWAGVAFHLTGLAQPLAEGWRATFTIGYANVTGLLILVGLLCSSAVASVSQTSADRIRCWLLATGILATQSRSVLLAAVICGVVLCFTDPPMARVLGSSALWGLLTFAGLLPSIRGQSAGFAAALVAAAVILFLQIRPAAISISLRGRAILRLAATLGVVGLVAVVLRARILDAGSDSGRLRLWLAAARHLRWSGIWGSGPGQVAEISRGQLVTLLAHSDPLQYAGYYGLPGMIAFVLIGLRIITLLAGQHGNLQPEAWSAGLTVTIALACVTMVDFPLQVPLVPGIVCLALGATIGPGTAGTALLTKARSGKTSGRKTGVIQIISAETR